MTRTKAPDARIVPHIRGKPVTWLTPLPPNRGPTEAKARHAVTSQMEGKRLPPERGMKPAVRQNIERRGREPTIRQIIEPTIHPIRAVSGCASRSMGDSGYSTDRRIRGPNLRTTVRIREGPTTGRCFARPRCRGDTRAGDIKENVFACGNRSFGRESDAAG